MYCEFYSEQKILQESSIVRKSIRKKQKVLREIFSAVKIVQKKRTVIIYIYYTKWQIKSCASGETGREGERAGRRSTAFPKCRLPRGDAEPRVIIFIKMQKKLAKYLDEDRYEHTLGVMFTCAALAMVHDCDLITAQTAGLLHDCAKCIPNKKKLKMCSQHHISVSEFEQEHPFLLHAKLGAYVAKAKYDVTDENILSAITWHTTGKPEMTLLEKIVYIADYIEPKRDKAPNLAIVRKLAFQDLDECMYKILGDTLAYLEENPKDIDNATKDAFLYYRDLHMKRQS